MKVRFLPFGLAAALSAAAPLRASVINLPIDPGFGSAENTGATAIISLSFSQRETDDLLTISMENTTPASIGSKLTAVGLELPGLPCWGIDFAPRGASSYFDTLTFGVSVSPAWLDAPGGYDLMITSDGNFDGGSPLGAPAAGETQVVTVTLGDTGLTSAGLRAVFVDFYAGSVGNFVIARFQAVGPEGDRSDSVLGGVPEPGSLGLVIVGGLLLLRRRSTS